MISPYECFTYDSPIGKLHADPTHIVRKLREYTGNRIDELTKQAYFLTQIEKDKDDPDYREYDSSIPEHLAMLNEAFQAEEIILKAVRMAFNLQPFDPRTGSGITESFLWKLFNDFSAYVQEQKKNTGS